MDFILLLLRKLGENLMDVNPDDRDSNLICLCGCEIFRIIYMEGEPVAECMGCGDELDLT
jgi:hypothetical protein